MSQIVRAVERLVKTHGGLRKAARATGIQAPYLCRLRSGAKDNPSDEILSKLGIERRVTYRKAP